MSQARHNMRPRVDWHVALGLAMSAPLLAACASIPGSGTGNTTGPSTEGAAPSAAAQSSASTSPDCIPRTISLGEMQSVISAGRSALATFRSEDIVGAGYMDDDGGPTKVTLVEFTGPNAIPPEADSTFEGIKVTAEKFARELGIPSGELDLGGETGLQSGNAGLKTEETPGAIVMLPSNSQALCNIAAYPRG